MTKRIIATLLIAVLMLNIWPVSGVSAVEDPQIVVDNATGIPGGTVDVTIRLVNNPGIASMKLKVSFGEELALNAVAYNSAIGGMSMQPPKMTSPVTLNWFNGIANSEGDWIFATLSFTVAEDAQLGTYPITVTYEADNVYNIAEDNIYFAVVNGGVEAVCGHPNKVATAANAATCEQPGNHLYYTCPDCGKVLKADGVTETLPEAEHIPAKGHTWGAWTQVKAPACDAEGQDQRTCSACGEVQVRDTRISGDPDQILVSAPRPEGYFEGKQILLIGDSITAGVGVNDKTKETYGALLAELLGATVTNKGISGSGYCTGGAMKTNNTLTEANVRDADVITIMLGINDFSWAVKDGYWNGVSGYYDESKTYYQLGDFDSTDTSTFYGALHSWCQTILELKQLEGFEDKQFVVITPMITSWNVSMGVKNDWDQSKTNVHGHTLRQYCTAIMEVCAYYDIPVFDANMFSGIYYNSAEDNNVDITGGDGVHVNAAGHALLANALAEFLMEGYTYEDRTVTDCGHSFEATVTAPTCTEQGYTTHRCPKCHYSYVDSYVAATGHSSGKPVAENRVEPDCEDAGSYEEVVYCTVCNAELSRTEKVLEATGHSYKAVVTAPTCTEQGYTTHTCADCGDSYVDSYVNANGHSYGAWTTTKAATCTAKGTERRDCKNCDHYETRDIAATGHSYKAVVTAPTCTEQGYTTHTCADCGDSYVDSYVNAKGHSHGEPVVENEGPHGSHDLVVYCTECGAELSREYDDGYLPGDINGDGQVNNKDVTRLFQYLSNYDVIVVEEALDVNGDGSINNKDLTRLFQYLSNYDVEIH